MIAPPRPSALAGGASSPVRAGAAVGGAPFVQARGRGPYAYDATGRAYVDYVMAYGPLLFGHAHPALVTGLDAIAARGTVYGSTTHDEMRLAERISAHVPSMERLRFVSTGTEAMMSAVRVARAYTGRSVVARFAGNYHGHFDGALHDAGASAGVTRSSVASGITDATRAQSVVARYGDLADLDARLRGREGDVAAILVEPIACNMGLVLPEPGFLDGLARRARALGALLVYDEVITWPRVGLGGAQANGGPVPDLTALGKVLGGGFPLAAFGGRAEVMAALSPEGASFTGGTFSGNPFSIAMGHRTLDLIEGDADFYARLRARTEALASGMRAAFRKRALDIAVVRHESMLDFAFRRGDAVRNYDERARADGAAFAAYYHAMRGRGVLLAPSPNELMFVSSAHDAACVSLTLDAFGASLDALRAEGHL